jgi:hypothetical protein
MTHEVCELFFCLGGGITSDNHVPLFCNYHVVINIAYNPVLQFNMIEQNILKLIHFIKKKINDGIFCISFVNSENQLADIFTKDLSSRVFHSISCNISITNIYALS